MCVFVLASMSTKPIDTLLRVCVFCSLHHSPMTTRTLMETLSTTVQRLPK